MMWLTMFVDDCWSRCCCQPHRRHQTDRWNPLARCDRSATKELGQAAGVHQDGAVVAVAATAFATTAETTLSEETESYPRLLIPLAGLRARRTNLREGTTSALEGGSESA